jgi:outer membrane murein-binding lipoprotein Lpp
MNHCNQLSTKVQDLTLKNNQLVQKIESMMGEEESAIEEIGEILELINQETNEEFEFLIDAVSFLLELG